MAFLRGLGMKRSKQVILVRIWDPGAPRVQPAPQGKSQLDWDVAAVGETPGELFECFP